MQAKYGWKASMSRKGSPRVAELRRIAAQLREQYQQIHFTSPDDQASGERLLFPVFKLEHAMTQLALAARALIIFPLERHILICMAQQGSPCLSIRYRGGK